MTMEKMGSFEDRRVFLGNQMQMQLADKYHEDLGDFIQNRAEGFRGLLQAQPELFDEYSRNPEETLTKIGETLYH